MVIGEKSNKQQLTASVTTAKTTLAHNAVVKARDEAYQVSFLSRTILFSMS